MEWRFVSDWIMIVRQGSPSPCGGKHGAGAMNKQTAIALLMALSASTAALAETQEEQQACTNDAFQFCQNAIPDRDRVFACLAERRHVISALCQTAMAPYLPAEPVVKKVAVQKPVVHKTAKNKSGPLVLAPH
jgi:hypothetical protein